MFNTKLVDKFYEALFCTDFNNYSSETQNAKTDNLSECKDFNEWLDMLISVFAKETRLSRTMIRTGALADTKFINSMKVEYEDLLELCDDDDDEEE